jgi:hypothetical protein
VFYIFQRRNYYSSRPSVGSGCSRRDCPSTAHPWIPRHRCAPLAPRGMTVRVSALSVCSVVSVGSVFSVGSAMLRSARNDRCPSPCAPLLRGRATQRTVTAPATQFPGLTPWVMRISPLRGFICVSALSVCSVVSVGSVFSVGSATVDSATPLRFARNDRRLSSCGRSRPRAYALGYRNVAPSGLCLCICSLRLLCRLCGLCCLCGLCYLCVLCTKSKGPCARSFPPRALFIILRQLYLPPLSHRERGRG